MPYLRRVEKDGAIYEGGETGQEARGVYAHSQQLVKRFGPETRRYVIFQEVAVTSCLFCYLGISKRKVYYIFGYLIEKVEILCFPIRILYLTILK